MKRLILAASLIYSVQSLYAAEEVIRMMHRQQQQLAQVREQVARKDAAVTGQKLELNNSTLRSIIGLNEVYNAESKGYNVTRDVAVISMIWKDIEVNDFRPLYERYESFAGGIAKEAASGPGASRLDVKLNPHVQRNLAALRQLRGNIQNVLNLSLLQVKIEGVGDLDLL